jgi:hypothetical protein
MANANSTAVSRKSTELHVEQFDWGTYYRGTEEAFVAAGLIKPEWFPGKPGNPKISVLVGVVDGEMKVIPYLSMSDRERRDRSSIRISKAGKRFSAYIDHPHEELERIEEEGRRKRLRERIEKQHAEKKKELDDFPKSSEQFIAQRSHITKGMLEVIFNFNFCRAHGGYHYSREVIEKARDLISDLVELAEEGKVYFDKVRYQYAMDDIEEKHVKANPEFSAFMASTLAIGKVALDE